MHEKAENGWFKPWMSVQNAVLILALCFVIALFDLSKSELASWVQAIGAIISIWAAWYIASQQSKRVEKAALRQNLTKCAAIIEVLNYALSAIDYESEADNEWIDAGQIRADIQRVLIILERVDLFSLPDPVFVNAVCVVRRAYERFDKKLIAHEGQVTSHSHYQHGIARFCINEIQTQIDFCVDTASKLSK